VVEVQSTLALPKALHADQWLYTSTKKNLNGIFTLGSNYFTLKVSEDHFSNKSVELKFLVLPCLKSDIQRPLVPNNGTKSEDNLQKLIYKNYIY
jgi:hypothetical protein